MILFQLKKYNHTGDSGLESERNSVLYVFMLCSAVTLALGVLTGWHCKLISCGETSIEWHINIEDARKLKKRGLVSQCFLVHEFDRCKLCLFHLQVLLLASQTAQKPHTRCQQTQSCQRKTQACKACRELNYLALCMHCRPMIPILGRITRHRPAICAEIFIIQLSACIAGL